MLLSALKIHISPQTADSLAATAKFNVESRGEIEIKVGAKIISQINIPY